MNMPPKFYTFLKQAFGCKFERIRTIKWKFNVFECWQK